MTARFESDNTAKLLDRSVENEGCSHEDDKFPEGLFGGTWEDGLRAIEEFDWSTPSIERQEHHGGATSEGQRQIERLGCQQEDMHFKHDDKVLEDAAEEPTAILQPEDVSMADVVILQSTPQKELTALSSPLSISNPPKKPGEYTRVLPMHEALANASTKVSSPTTEYTIANDGCIPEVIEAERAGSVRVEAGLMDEARSTDSLKEPSLSIQNEGLNIDEPLDTMGIDMTEVFSTEMSLIDQMDVDVLTQENSLAIDSEFSSKDSSTGIVATGVGLQEAQATAAPSNHADDFQVAQLAQELSPSMDWEARGKFNGMQPPVFNVSGFLRTMPYGIGLFRRSPSQPSVNTQANGSYLNSQLGIHTSSYATKEVSMSDSHSPHLGLEELAQDKVHAPTSSSGPTAAALGQFVTLQSSQLHVPVLHSQVAKNVTPIVEGHQYQHTGLQDTAGGALPFTSNATGGLFTSPKAERTDVPFGDAEKDASHWPGALLEQQLMQDSGVLSTPDTVQSVPGDVPALDRNSESQGVSDLPSQFPQGQPFFGDRHPNTAEEVAYGDATDTLPKPHSRTPVLCSGHTMEGPVASCESKTSSGPIPRKRNQPSPPRKTADTKETDVELNRDESLDPDGFVVTTKKQRMSPAVEGGTSEGVRTNAATSQTTPEKRVTKEVKGCTKEAKRSAVKEGGILVEQLGLNNHDVSIVPSVKQDHATLAALGDTPAPLIQDAPHNLAPGLNTSTTAPKATTSNETRRPLDALSKQTRERLKRESHSLGSEYDKPRTRADTQHQKAEPSASADLSDVEGADEMEITIEEIVVDGDVTLGQKKGKDKARARSECKPTPAPQASRAKATPRTATPSAAISAATAAPVSAPGRNKYGFKASRPSGKNTKARKSDDSPALEVLAQPPTSDTAVKERRQTRRASVAQEEVQRESEKQSNIRLRLRSGDGKK